MSARNGALANAFGFLVAKGMAIAMGEKIGSMPRNEEKRFLRDNIFHCSQGHVNECLHEFTNSSLLEKTRLIENSGLFVYKSGIYSTFTSSSLLTGFSLLMESSD